MEDEAEETQQSTVDNYTGVSIKVRLSSRFKSFIHPDFRCPSIPRLMKAFGYSNCREVRNPSLHWLLVRQSHYLNFILADAFRSLRNPEMRPCSLLPVR